MMFAAFILAALGPLSVLAAPGDYTYERLDKEDALLLVVDIQEGLIAAIRDFLPTEYKQQAITHAAIGQAFDLPVILTTSTEGGPNGRTMTEISDMYPDAPLIRREGEVNAWDSEPFRDAVASFNKSQIILGGIVTDVCTTHLALSLREAGYSVWANAEASGTTSQLAREVANTRMIQAGVNVVTPFSIFGELMGDWRNTPGALELFPWLDKYMAPWGGLARAHARAVTNGTLLDGQDQLPY